MSLLQSKPHVSASQLLTLDRCGVQYEFIYEQRMRRRPGIAMIRGIAVNEAVTTDLRRKIGTGALAPAEELREVASYVFRRELEHSSEELTAEDRAAAGEERDAAIEMATLHHAELAPTIQPTHVERELRVEIQGFPYDVLAYLDIQEGLRRVRDTKTKSQAPPKSSADDSLQLTTYSLAVKVHDGAPPAEVALDVLWTTKTQGAKSRTLTSTRGPEDYADLLARIERLAIARERGVFLPAARDSWVCSAKWCGFFDVCPFGRRGRSVHPVQE